jgi:hypothetical protein
VGVLVASRAVAAPDTSSASELSELVARFALDRDALERRYSVESSAETAARFRSFYAEWRKRVEEIPFDTLGVEGRIDAVLLRKRIEADLEQLGRKQQWLAQAAPLVPFRSAIVALNDSRLRLESLDPVQAATTLAALVTDVDRARSRVDASPKATARLDAFRAQEEIAELKGVLASWYEFYAGYDPIFTWWVAAPRRKLDEALDAYRTLLREKVLGIKAGEDDPIVGTPIGRAAVVSDLDAELVPYTPEDLLAIGEHELAWCEAEMKKAAAAMGLGDDWKAALERVKADHVAPGRQADLVRDLAREAEAYVEQHDLVTVPPLAKEIWRMEMMSPERQKVNPFFLGGEVISVSFPTDAMEHGDKLMSLRGNNVHFARATVFHELIPGHHLQGFMRARYNPHRELFRTPFWVEGWALYWEMLLWDRGFPKTPENRIGMLFWRMHRAARIIFSLRFHLGDMTPEQCIEFLVNRVGHERANATAEVRRSFNAGYRPLYQAAYMIGGLQLMALRRELVETGQMTDRAFHDAILMGGPMPIETVRARLTKSMLARDHRASWKFAGESPARRPAQE